MQYINRIQQMATVQQIQQQQQVQQGQQTQQQTGTVHVQGVVTSQPQLGQAHVAQVQQGAMQAQQSQPGQQQVASQEIEQSSDAQNVRQTMTQASGTPQQYTSFVGQVRFLLKARKQATILEFLGVSKKMFNSPLSNDILFALIPPCLRSNTKEYTITTIVSFQMAWANFLIFCGHCS